MKIKKELKVGARTARAAYTKIETRIACDFCHVIILDQGSYGFYGKCSICKRDICYKCTSTDPHDIADYADSYCPICYDLKFIRFGDRQADIDERHYEEQESFDKMIKKESLKEEDENRD